MEYSRILDESPPENEVGYRVRLWALHLSSLGTARPDRQITGRFVMTFPEVDPRVILAVSFFLFTVFQPSNPRFLGLLNSSFHRVSRLCHAVRGRAP